MQYSAPTQLLVDEHTVILSVLDAIESMAARQNGRFSAQFMEKAFDLLPAFADRFHHAKEETLLFPMLEARGVPREYGPIGCMLKEHDQGRAHVAAVKQALRDVADGKPEAATRVRSEAMAYVRLLRQHIMKENGILFVVADQCLTPQDKDELMARIETTQREQFPANEAERCRKLASELCEQAAA